MKNALRWETKACIAIRNQKENFLYLFCYLFVFLLLSFCISFVIFLYFFCYLFVFLFIILSHETCISMRNQSLHCDQRPKGKLFVFQHITSQGRKKHLQSVQNDDIVVDITHLRWRAFYLFNWNNVHKMACALLEMGQGTICNVAVSSSKKQTPKTNNCNQEYQPMTTIPTTIKLINLL